MKPSTIALGLTALGVGVTAYLVGGYAARSVVSGPLRAAPRDPAAGPPGPLSQRYIDFFGNLPDDELFELRSAMPAHWWEFLVVVQLSGDDSMIPVILSPVKIDFDVMPEQDRADMSDAIISAIGFDGAGQFLELLQESGVTQ